MHRLSKTSKGRLNSCNDDIQIIVNAAISVSRVDFGIAEGHRSVEKQQEYFKAGKSRVDGIKIKGKHNYSPSQAFDIYGWVAGKINYEKETMCYLAGLIVGVSEMLYKDGKTDHKLRWGGNWDKDGIILKDQSFDDMPHFEIYKPK
jgi:peptidoglycan L-alanyl-D-glutamate endopeptidase CwlK